MPKKESPVVAAYFYPHDRQDPSLLARAQKQRIVRVPSDYELLARATPLFDGHEHPQYTIGRSHMGEWSDADPSAIAVQAELAISYGIDAWIVLAYAGMIDGKPHSELNRPLRYIANSSEPNLKYALMTCFGLPRINLPVPKDIRSFRHGEGKFDISKETMCQMIDFAATHWNNPRYLFLNGQPFLAIYGLNKKNAITIARSNPDIAHELRRYSEEKYGVTPLLAATTVTLEAAQLLRELGFDHITTYSSLPTFNGQLHDDVNSQPPFSALQSYRAQLALRKIEWQQIQTLPGVTFIPNASVGWDASARGEPGLTLAEIKHNFPWTPIITDSSPENFRYGLEQVWQFIQHLPIETRILFVLAWNEIGDGAALLPRVNPDTSLDFTYLETLKLFLESLTHQP